MGDLAVAPYAERARAAHAAMCARFEQRDGMLRRDGRLHLPGTVAHVWPFARAFVATLDVAGMGSDGAAGSLGAVVDHRLEALERYWDDRGPAYASDPPGGRVGGDIYYDDNAWVGLALVQLARGGERAGAGAGARAGADGGPLERAAQVAAFARGGWDPDRSPAGGHPGGVFWVQQGRGIGARNHDRNAISTAPNAELILHLSELGIDHAGAVAEPTPERLCAWVTDALTGAGGLVRDKIRGDGSVDQATWSYNQGSMIGLHVLLARQGGDRASEHLAAARELAVRSLDHYAENGYAGEPDEFVAIFARNLLLLHAAGEDDALRGRIASTLRERADAAWARADRRRLTLLGHSALVSLQALVAWDPADYARLA